jgi:hypothetical protein
MWLPSSLREMRRLLYGTQVISSTTKRLGRWLIVRMVMVQQQEEAWEGQGEEEHWDKEESKRKMMMMSSEVMRVRWKALGHIYSDCSWSLSFLNSLYTSH